jgi:hypothetical protein
MSVSNLLVGGVTVMTMIVAWADRRRGWLSALVVVTILTLLWPIGVQSATTTLLVQSGAASVFAVPLVPVLMAFVFALTRRKDATAPGTQNIATDPM